MFETSVVQERVQSRFSLLSISFIVHSAVVVGAVAASIATVDFPTNAPDEFQLAPVQVRVPPPLGTPNGGATKPEVARPKPATPPPPPSETVAPRIVPETVEAAGPVASSDLPSNGDATEAGPVGVPWGEQDSVGEIDAPPSTATAALSEPKIYEVRGEVRAPKLIRRVDPPYPHNLIRTRLQATVVVRCIIDRNGRVRDPQIVSGALPPFNQAVIEAVQKWRFTPGSLHGEAVETYLDLTVNFAVR